MGALGSQNEVTGVQFPKLLLMYGSFWQVVESMNPACGAYWLDGGI